MVGADQNGMAVVDYLCIKDFVYYTSYPVTVLHSNGIGFLWDRFSVICVNLHFSEMSVSNTCFIL